MKAEFKDGDRVWYHPIINRMPRFAGVVDGDPWRLGGRDVVDLRDMEPAYSEYLGRDKKRVNAASFDALGKDVLL